MNTVRISAHNMRLLIEDKNHFNERFKIVKKRFELAPTEEDKECCLNSLHALNNIHQYKPLIDETDNVFKKYPQFFIAKSNQGVVYALRGDGLELDDQTNQGFSTDYVPVKNIIAKSTFTIGTIGNPCQACKAKEFAKIGIRIRS